MANIYVRSTDGLDTDSGLTWALAKATIGGAAAIDSTTDRTIMVSDNHAENISGSTAWAWAGTQAAPTIIRCVDDSAEPPTATAATATVTCDNTLNLSSSANWVWVEGIAFFVGSGAATHNIQMAGGTGGYFKATSCEFRIQTTSGSAQIQAVNGTAAFCRWSDVDVRFSAAGQSVATTGAGFFVWEGGSLLSGGTSPNALVGTLANGSVVHLSGIDLTNASSGINLFNSASSSIKATVRNCKLPNSWTGSIHSGTPGRNSRFSLYNCDDADTNYALHIKTELGDILSEATIVRSGGASDGTTPISWKMVSNADAEWPLLWLESDEIVRWQETVGSSITVTVETITDNVTLTDVEFWIEVMYLGESGRPLGKFSSSANTNTLASGTNLTTSSETWTTTGLTTPVKQKASVSFTPQEKGFLHVTCKLAKASTTVYVDPELTVT